MAELTLAYVFISLFCIVVAASLVYLAYVYYLKNYKAYRYEDGVPNAAIFRSSSSKTGGAGINHFSAASCRLSQYSLKSNDRNSLLENTERKYAYPSPSSSSPSSKISNIPEVRIELV